MGVKRLFVGATTRGNMLVQRHCNKCVSDSTNKKTHHDSCSAQRKPKAKKSTPSRNMCFISSTFSDPGPLSPHPWSRVLAGWGDLGDSRGGKLGLGHTTNTSLSVYGVNPRKHGVPPTKNPQSTLSYRPARVYFLGLCGW